MSFTLSALKVLKQFHGNHLMCFTIICTGTLCLSLIKQKDIFLFKKIIELKVFLLKKDSLPSKPGRSWQPAWSHHQSMLIYLTIINAHSSQTTEYLSYVNTMNNLLGY